MFDPGGVLYAALRPNKMLRNREGRFFKNDFESEGWLIWGKHPSCTE